MDHQKLRDYLARVAPDPGVVESYRDLVPAMQADDGALEAAFPSGGPPDTPPADLVTGALSAVQNGEPLAPEQAHALEAIVLPRERPVVDVVDGTCVAIEPPFAHFAAPAVHRVLDATIPSVGRVELPGHPSLPYGGTAFVVGDGLMMTNRNVAELFTSGLGADGLAFLPDREAGVDFRRENGRDASLFVAVDRVVMVHPHWDMALLAVSGLPADQASLTLATAEPGDFAGEVAVIGYPALDPATTSSCRTRSSGACTT